MRRSTSLPRTPEYRGAESLSAPAAQFLDTSLRVATLAADVGTNPVYDTGWRSLPFPLVSEWQCGHAYHECAGGEPRVIAPGEAIILPAGVRHRTRNAGEGDAVVRWAHVRFSIFEATDLLNLLDIPPIIPPPAAQRLGEICQSLAEIGELPAQGWTLPAATRKKVYEMQLLAEIVSLAPPRPASYGILAGMQRLAPVLQYIEDHFTEPLRRATLADIVCLTPGYFDALFKQLLHITPQEYIKRLRIRRAQELLLHTDLTVAAIAASTGYNDPFHFSRQFHAACGAGPTHYRRQHKGSLATIG